MWDPLEVSSEGSSLSPEQFMEPKKPCNTCCDLDPLRPVEPREKEVGFKYITGDGAIILRQTLGAYKPAQGWGVRFVVFY